MNHDPERWAAAYLEGLPARERAEFEEHLLACEECWREVSLARTGRALAEGIQDRAPAGLRDSIRAGVAAAAADPQPGTNELRVARALAVAAAAVVILVGGLAVWRPWPSPDPIASPAPSPVAEAVAHFRVDQLPGTTVPALRAPDLSPLGLRLVGAAAGTLDGVHVTVFAYRDDTGARLDVYRSARPIPEAGEAHELGDDADAWRSNVGGVTVICGPATHTVLLIGSDPSLVDHAGRLLDVV